MDDESSDLQLLLCDAGDGAPALDGGLSESALGDAQAPERGPRGKDSMMLEALHRDPNDLRAQRWAVVAPEGADGDHRLEAIAALISHRGAQQGAAPKIFRVPAAMDAFDSLRWKNDVLRDEDVAVDERPRYVLILGDLDEVSLEFQHVLANGAFVGRLHCRETSGYRAYAEKVVGRERAPAEERARALYYTVQDGTAAVGVGYRHLVEPCMRMTRDLEARGKLDAEEPAEIPYSDWGPDELLAMAGVDAPAMLLSLSHGLGAPRRGWRTPDHQRALQGALALGPDGPLSAEMVEETPFLPGGVWMCVACFGAGTPPESAYYPWLSLLAERGGASASDLAGVMRSLPKDGERPFVAALPQALLANPDGPLAVLGHMDLAWTFGFSDPQSKRSRASRMLAAQRAILSGARVGVGLDALMHAYRETNDELTARYQLQRDARARGRPDPVSPRELGTLWMQRNDLRGYVLLGDPAARLGIAGHAPLAAVEAAELAEPAIGRAAADDLRSEAPSSATHEAHVEPEATPSRDSLAGLETPRAPDAGAARAGGAADQLEAAPESDTAGDRSVTPGLAPNDSEQRESTRRAAETSEAAIAREPIAAASHDADAPAPYVAPQAAGAPEPSVASPRASEREPPVTPPEHRSSADDLSPTADPERSAPTFSVDGGAPGARAAEAPSDGDVAAPSPRADVPSPDSPRRGESAPMAATPSPWDDSASMLTVAGAHAGAARMVMKEAVMEHETPHGRSPSQDPSSTPTPAAAPHGPIPSGQHINAGAPPSYAASPTGPWAPPHTQPQPLYAQQPPLAAYRGPPPPPSGAAPVGAISRPRTIENPEIALRERAVLAMLRGDEAPRSIAVRFGLPLEEIFYWLDVYREAGRRALAG